MNRSLYVLIALAAVCVIAAFVYIAIEICQRKKSAAGKDTAALEEAQEICMKILTRSGLMLFTEAERQYGSGTGSLKLSSVVTQVVALLPDWVKEVVDMDWLIEQIEAKLVEAKEQWKANEKLSLIANSNSFQNETSSPQQITVK